MADINPAFDTQTVNPLPVAFGYVNGGGFAGPSYVDITNDRYAFMIGFDGECDGPEQLVYFTQAHLYTPPLRGSRFGTINNATIAFPNGCNFHPGMWTPIGATTTQTSAGNDQLVDANFALLPTVTPPQSFSGMCYWAIAVPFVGTGNRGYVEELDPITPYGVFRGARCRYFDANGNVTGYGFTTNPTWHAVEAILRYKIKRQQPQVAGLTDAEKACFNWPDIVAHAQRNDFVLANGAPRFMGNYIFAAQSTLASMLETMMRCCRSYVDIRNGKIGFYGFDQQTSNFALTSNHILPGTFSVAKKNLKTAPNVFVPKFRDLGIPALISVISANCNSNGAGPLGTTTPVQIQSGTWEVYFDTGGVNPFISGDILFYGDGSNPAMDTWYFVDTNFDETVTPLPVWAEAATDEAMTSTGGYMGTLDSRFAKRAPTTVQHRRHQLAAGQIAPGITPLPNITQVEYDLGNMTYDQANRLMKYELAATLGDDVAGWTAPKTGTMRVRLDAVDANGNAFFAMRPWQMFTVDDTVDGPASAGNYLIDGAAGGIKIIPPCKDELLGAIEVNFRTPPTSYSDVSDPPDDSLRTIASATLEYLGTSQQMSNVAWVIQATLSATIEGSTMTVAIPDLTLQILGRVGFTKYPTASWTGLTSGQPYVLYVVDGATPTFGFQTGTTPTNLPANAYVVIVGVLTA